MVILECSSNVKCRIDTKTCFKQRKEQISSRDKTFSMYQLISGDSSISIAKFGDIFFISTSL